MDVLGTWCVQGRELPGIAGVQDAGKNLVEVGALQAERIWIQKALEWQGVCFLLVLLDTGSSGGPQRVSASK